MRYIREWILLKNFSSCPRVKVRLINPTVVSEMSASRRVIAVSFLLGTAELWQAHIP